MRVGLVLDPAQESQQQQRETQPDEQRGRQPPAQEPTESAQRTHRFLHHVGPRRENNVVHLIGQRVGFGSSHGQLLPQRPPRPSESLLSPQFGQTHFQQQPLVGQELLQSLGPRRRTGLSQQVVEIGGAAPRPAPPPLTPPPPGGPPPPRGRGEPDARVGRPPPNPPGKHPPRLR